MAVPDPRCRRIREFNHLLDARLDSEAADAAGPAGNVPVDLPVEDLEALDLALRLAALNPSLESGGRYPLRRRLRAQSARKHRGLYRRVDFLVEVFRAWMRPAAGLSMSLALIFVFGWVFAGLAFSAAGSHPVTPTAYRMPATMAGLVASPAPLNDSLAAGFSPQPIPTPAAPAAASAGTRTTQDTSLPRLTPVLAGQQNLPVMASPAIP